MKTENQKWWDSLSDVWKVEFINQFHYFASLKKEPYKEIIKSFNGSSYTIEDIVNLKEVIVSGKVWDDLSPVFYLKKLYSFGIEDPILERLGDSEYYYNELIFLYPKQLRKKVRTLFYHNGAFSGNFYDLEDFINLEAVYFQASNIGSLDGIQNLKKLKIFHADQGNSYSDLTPLKDLPLKDINIEFTNVTDISPLTSVKTLETINLYYCEIQDYSPLFELPNLKAVYGIEDNDILVKELKNRGVCAKLYEYDFCKCDFCQKNLG